jgi:hypothetical protein
MKPQYILPNLRLKERIARIDRRYRFWVRVLWSAALALLAFVLWVLL